MTVKELKKQLEAYSDEQEIWVSQDPEGNAFFELDGLYQVEWFNKPQAVIYPNHKLTRIL